MEQRTNSAISTLREALAAQCYRPEVKEFAEYQHQHYAWVQKSADVHTGQPSLVQLVACLIDDPEFRQEYLSLESDLRKLCAVAEACDQRRSLATVRQQMLGDRKLTHLPDGTIGLEPCTSAPVSGGLDVGEPPPLPAKE